MRIAVWGALLALLLCLPVFSGAQPSDAGAGSRAAPPDVPGGDGTLRGVVLEAVKGTPLPDVEIALYALSAEGVPGLRRGRSDEQGRFAFEGIARSANLAYLVGARYRDVPFPGARVVFAPDETVREVEVRISPLSSERAALAMGAAELRLQRTPTGIRLVQTLRVENPGPATFHVSPAQRAAHEPALRARLPAGAENFQMPLGVIPEGVERRGRELLWWGPVHPGSQELVFSVDLPAGDPERVALDWELPDGAESLRLWIPSGARLETRGLTPAALPPEANPGYAAFDAPRAAPGHSLAVAVQLPAARLVPDAAKAVEVRAVLTVDDAAIEVTETHVLQVEGEDRVLGTHEMPLYRLALPPNLARLRFGTSGTGVTSLPDDRGGLILMGEAEPGELRVEIAYRLPSAGFPARFERTLDRATPLLSVYIADTGNLLTRSDRLHGRRPARTSDLTYLHLEAFQIDAGETVGVEIARQPPRMRLSDSAHRGAVALGGVLVLVLLVGPLWSGRAEGRVEEEPESPARREREAVVAALRDLEHDFETGKVEADEYPKLRQALRSQAIALLRQEREGPAPAGDGEAEPAAAAEARHCMECGTPALAAQRFCGHCGSRLGEPPDEGADA